MPACHTRRSRKLLIVMLDHLSREILHKPTTAIRRATQQRPTQRAPGRLDMGSSNLTTTFREKCSYESDPPSPQLLAPFFAACAIDIFPAIALLDDRFQIFPPDQLVLHRVFDDRADQTGGDIGGVETAIAEVRRQR